MFCIGRDHRIDEKERLMFRKWQGILIAAVLAAATPSFGAIYNDATGDLHDGTGGGANFTGFTHLDIASVEVTNDATDIYFTFTLQGDVIATDWGKYMVGIDIDGNDATGDDNGNGWVRPITMNPDGMDYWIGTWVDSGNGAELRRWDGAAWQLDLATYNPPPGDITMNKTQFTGTVKVPLASMGLSNGDMFFFDAYSSGGGGGDSAVDALSSSTPSITDWGGPFNSPGNSGLSKYTVIPEPGTIVLVGLGALGIRLGCRRRRK
jgi:hypothetical protein